MADATKAVKHALIGTAMGSVVAMGGDYVFTTLVPLLMPNNGSSSSMGDDIGRAAVAVVVSSATAGLAFYAGDLLMAEMGGIDDPLQGIFFYYTLWNSMAATSVTPRYIRTLVSTLVSTATPMPRQSASTQASVQEDDRSVLQSGKKPCTTSGCGGLQGF